MKGTEQELIEKLLGHIKDAKAIVKTFRGPTMAVVKEATAFYTELREAAYKFDDDANKRQSDRIFDLIENAGLTSADVIDLLKFEGESRGNLLGTLLSSEVLQGGIGILSTLMGDAIGKPHFVRSMLDPDDAS